MSITKQQEVWKQKVDLFRRRFGAREDVFGVKNTYFKTVTDKETGEKRREEVSVFSPQCENFGNQSLCQISMGTGNCTGCPNKKYQKLTDEWIWKHISGQKDLILYLVRKDGIKFGACDFDYGSHFEDARTVRDYSLKLGLPCYIARSSKKGYHLYWFFSEPVPAHLFTSLITYIYGEVGFLARYHENSSIPLPEVFPKQTVFEESKIGNGIKIPMIEPKMREGFNCWVNDDAVPVAFEDQWEHFKSFQEITPEKLGEVLELNKVFIIASPVGRSASAAKHRLSEPNQKKERPTPRGDFWKVVLSCPSLKQFWEKDQDGTYKFDKTANENGVPHMARVASLSIAVTTENGVEIVRDRWPGDRTDKEIRYAEETGQRPWTCKAMQDHGICRIGLHPRKHDHCLKKMPPAEMQNGIWVSNPNQLPESEWSEPSPYRFASGYMTYDQITERLTGLFAHKKDDKIPAPPNLAEEFYAILKTAKRLGPEEQKQVQDFITANKYVPAKELKSLDKRIVQEVRAEEHQERCGENPNFTFGNDTFFLQNGRYVMSSVDMKGNRHEKELTNFTVDIKEEIVVYEGVDESEEKPEQKVEERYFKCTVSVENRKRTFKIRAADWIRSGESFFGVLVNQAGGDLLYNKANYDHIRNCISHFSKEGKVLRKRVKDFGHYKIKGEHIYITPSVIVTKDQIRPNVNEFDLEFTDDITSMLDFKIIDDEQFKDLALHIIEDYFNCNSITATMTTFAHAMAASIMSHLPLNKSPVLWLSGTYSSGKSFIAEMAQNFYGNFGNLMGMNTTGKGKLLMAHNFRNALLAVDDFKAALSENNTREMINFIHAAYDRSGRQASKRDGTLREQSSRIRGLIATTGEDFPVQEASAISRMLLVEVGANSKRTDCGDRVKERKHEYSGFTPHFIQFVYNTDTDEVSRLYREYFELFESQSRKQRDTENTHRVSENLAFNMTAFRLSMEMLVLKGVIPSQRKEEFCAMHVKNLEIIRTKVMTNARTQKGANMFLEELQNILQDPSRYHIVNWPNFDPLEHRNSKPLGVYRPKSDPDVVYIYASTAHGEVNTAVKKMGNYLQTKQHIARQLMEDGHIPQGMWDIRNPVYCKQITTPMGARMYCWAVKLDSLGLDRSNKAATNKQVPESRPAIKSDADIINFAVSE